jgi:hypothetical protein
MKKTKNPALITIWIVLFCLSTFSLIIAQEKKYEGLLGTWDVETESGQYSFVFTFSMENGTLKGMFSGTSGEDEMENINYEDNKLTFTVNVDAGGQFLAIDFSVTIKEETMEGMLSLEYGESNITGKKREIS